MERWRVNLPRLVQVKLSLDCPELLSYAVSPVIIAISSRGSLDWVEERALIRVMAACIHRDIAFELAGVARRHVPGDPLAEYGW